MRLGIDFGTTHTVVACADRGNYPVVGFLDDSGDSVDFFPSIVAERAGELRFGFAAAAVETGAEPGWTVLRSFKRLLSGPDATPVRTITLGDRTLRVADLLARFAAALRSALLERSNLPAAGRETLEVVIATPANAHGTQRFLTLDAFRRAGFDVRALLNEPSAAGFEYSHRHSATLTSRREHIVVYDLGGGTFDASLVHMSGTHHDAVTTGGLAHLGGDDFDAVLAELALAAAHVDPASLDARTRARLAQVCREAKEGLTPNTRKLSIDLQALQVAGLGDVPAAIIAAADYADAVTPLVERTIAAMTPVMQRLDGEQPGEVELAGIYVVGGASALPVVGRLLRERFGRRVHRSPYPFAAVAIGLAIAADEGAGYTLTDRLSRTFGVFREADEGRAAALDVIFDKDTALPKDQPLTLSREYRAAHNVGHYRFVECSGDDLSPFADIVFPFDHALQHAPAEDAAAALAQIEVARTDGGPRIREDYVISPDGLVAVEITDLDSGYQRAFRLG